MTFFSLLKASETLGVLAGPFIYNIQVDSNYKAQTAQRSARHRQLVLFA